MPAPKVSDDEFIRIWHKHCSPQKVADEVGVHVRNVQERRRSLENKYKIILETSRTISPKHHELADHPGITNLQIDDGVVLVASDCHYYPGIITTGHTALVQFCKELQPKAIIMNGDVFDGANASRHPPIGWENKPSIIQEIETCQQRLCEIEDASNNARKIWTLGNHDSRFNTRLAAQAREYANVHGFQLKDHFPKWQPAWSAWINDDVVIKHRFKGGVHAAHNNAVGSGMTMVTGHTHSLKVTPYTDYRGTRWGVETGCISPVYGPQTSDYTELNPVSWRQGFAVLTFHNGKLLWPELVHVCGENQVEFRGKVHTIEPA